MLPAAIVSENIPSTCARDSAPTNWQGTTVFAPGALSLHPGSLGQVTIVRFTVPLAGQYLVSGEFFGQDYIGQTTTDVHLLLNGVSIFNDVVSDFGTSHPFNTTLTVAAGSQLDFAVGFGGNSYFYDSTGLSAVITAVPEPTTLALAGVSAGLFCLIGRRKNPAA